MSMYPKNMLFTSASVTEGHPDKFCDQISDAVADECPRRDPLARVACECHVTMGALVRQVFPLSPKGIIDHLKLRHPGYLQTATYGDFGRPEFAWERTDATDELPAKARKA